MGKIVQVHQFNAKRQFIYFTAVIDNRRRRVGMKSIYDEAEIGKKMLNESRAILYLYE